jgi:hypothetical protein
VSEPSVQLRRYRLDPERREAFVAWWREWIPAALDVYGLGVPFAYVVPETDEFVWAISHPGDEDEFSRVQAEYLKSPGRAAAFEVIPGGVEEMLIHFVTPA